MDLNGDGRISFDEMERFYSEIVANVVRMDMDVLIFNNLVNMVNYLAFFLIFFFVSKLEIIAEKCTFLELYYYHRDYGHI